MSVHPAPPSSARLFSAVRHMIVRKKLAGDVVRREYMVSNQELFLHFNPDAQSLGKVWNNRILHVGEQAWNFAASDNLNLLIGVDLLIPASIMIGQQECPRYQMGDDWCLTTEGIELIQLLKQDAAIDEAVRLRVRNRAMEQQELM